METLEKRNQEAIDVALALVGEFEGNHLTSYIFPGEGWATIGRGRAIPLKQHPMTIDQATADRWCREDLSRRVERLYKEIPVGVLDKLNANQFGALVSFRYNLKDSAWLDRRCNTRKLLIRGDIKQFADAMDEWFKGEGGRALAGLVRRRACERHLLEGGTLEQIKALRWYNDLIAPVNKKPRGHLAWVGTRLCWMPA